MRPFYYCLTSCMLLVSALQAQDDAERPVLVLETGGHTAICNWVQWTPDGERLLSGGDDKVIRIWDVRNPAQPLLERSLRLQVGPGNEGMMYAGALSPDGRWLAVGGFTTNRAENGDVVQILEVATGVIVAVLPGHTNVINGLTWSPGGELLVSASFDRTARVWDLRQLKTATGQLDADSVPVVELAEHTERVYSTAFLRRPGRLLRLVSSSADDTAILWEQQRDDSWKLIRQLEGHTDNVKEVVCSPDGRWIATSSFDRSVRLWDADGTFVKVLAAKTDDAPLASRIDFSPDSKQLVIADRIAAGGSIILSIPAGEQLTNFDGHNNTLYMARFRPAAAGAPMIASTGGDLNEILIWDGQTGAAVGQIVGNGGSNSAAAFSPDGRQIAYGHIGLGSTLAASQPLTAAFDLLEFTPLSLEEPVDPNQWQRGQLSSNGYVAEPSADEIHSLVVRRDGRETCRISRDVNYDRIRCFAFLPGRGQIVVGSDFDLTIHAADTGELLRTFVGHTGLVYAVAISPDGRTLLSASDDQTLKMWELGNISSQQEPDTAPPLLSFFITKDAKEWVVWTEEGYYAASPNGDQLIGWHTNRGINQPAEFTAAWQYAKILKRPEILELVLTARSTEKAIALAAQAARTRPAPLVDISMEQDKLAVPKIQIESPKQYARITGGAAHLTGTVLPQGSQPITDVRVTVNKRPVNTGEKGIGVRPAQPAAAGNGPAAVPIDIEIPLLPGANLIEVIASTEFATSQPFAIEVVSEAPPLHKPTLYILGIGVADYEDKELTLQFPDDDITGVIAALQQQNGTFYADVVVDELLNEEVTEKNVRRSFKKLQENVTQHDVAILIVSGHGYSDVDGTYFFCPHDFDVDEPTITGIRWTEMTEPLKNLPCKVVLCMDTCHSAGVLGPKIGDARRNKSTSDAVRRAVSDLTSIEAGVVVLTSSTGSEVSFEDDNWGHGAFALALIEALTGKRKGPAGAAKLPADLNADGVLELTEIDVYITSRVKELTAGRQKPVTERGRIPSFPIAVSE